MDRIHAIDRLAGVLSDAGARADWELLDRVVRGLGPELVTLSASGPWSDAERSALGRLRGAHQGAADAVGRASSELRTRLDDMLVNKQGWMAYALAGELESDLTE